MDEKRRVSPHRHSRHGTLPGRFVLQLKADRWREREPGAMRALQRSFPVGRELSVVSTDPMLYGASVQFGCACPREKRVCSRCTACVLCVGLNHSAGAIRCDSTGVVLAGTRTKVPAIALPAFSLMGWPVSSFCRVAMAGGRTIGTTALCLMDRGGGCVAEADAATVMSVLDCGTRSRHPLPATHSRHPLNCVAV